MALPFNPWATPPNTGALPANLPLATPEYLDVPESTEVEATESDSMTQALAVIQQQSTLIGQLMQMLAPQDGN